MAATVERGEAAYPSQYASFSRSTHAEEEESEGSGSVSEDEAPSKGRGRSCFGKRRGVLAITCIAVFLLVVALMYYWIHGSSSESSADDGPSSDTISSETKCFPIGEVPPIKQPDGGFVVQLTSTLSPAELGPNGEVPAPVGDVWGDQEAGVTTTATTCIPVSLLPANTLSLSGHCATNPQDHEIWLHGNGATDFTSVMSRCAHSCWGRSDCVRDCVSKEDGYSTECSQCFADLTTCTMTHCLFNCMDGGNDCNVCVSENCNPAFWTCSGLEESVLVQAMVEMQNQMASAQPEAPGEAQQGRRLGRALVAAPPVPS